MTRRYNCRCGKKRYRDESAADAAAAADTAAYDRDCTAYRCPGGLAWHVTAHGYLPEALRSAGRRLAHALLTHERVDLATFGDRNPRRLEEVAATLVEAGVADASMRALDRAALERIVRVGLDGWLEESGRR